MKALGNSNTEGIYIYIIYIHFYTFIYFTIPMPQKHTHLVKKALVGCRGNCSRLLLRQELVIALHRYKQDLQLIQQPR